MKPVRLAAWLERCWYGHSPWRFVLAPLSLIFILIVSIRRLAYTRGWLRVTRLPVPVVVVGNISVGGTGKTPLVIWLAEQLRAAGWHPGVISRGYGGRSEGAVPADADPALYGDEPVLLARRLSCPVWVGRRRAEIGRCLLAAHPGVDVLISDDGLQHYALARDVEIAVIDGRRGLGNGWPLPAGPLREPARRLTQVDAVVINGTWTAPGPAPEGYVMRVVGDRFSPLADPTCCVGPDHFSARPATAIAGIGHPERFFAHLRALGLTPRTQAFPDHHAYRREELPAGTVLMTEKDAVKCTRLGLNDAWFLRVDAVLDAGLKEEILQKIGHRHGPETA